MASLQTLLRQLDTLLDFLEEANRLDDVELIKEREKRIDDFVGDHPKLAYHLHTQAQKPQTRIDS